MVFKKNIFLSKDEVREVVEAIKKAESQTCGEIRVHLEKSTSVPVIERAKEVFVQLGMANTKQKNGVLIYLALKNKLFAIIGDEGINRIVGNNYWDKIKDKMQEHFKKGEFACGLVEGIAAVGAELKKHFPYQQGDRNELSDEISIGG